MVVKQEFTLLKNVPNILKLSASDIKKYSIERGARKVFVVLDLSKSKIKHFTTDKVFGLIGNLEKRKKVAVVNIPDYNLYVSYNAPTKQIIMNLSPFNVDDIYPSQPDPKDLYTQLVYGILFTNLVTETIKLKDSYFTPISGFLLSLLMGLFGKEYGLLGVYSSNITKLHFLVNCYVLSSFFGITGLRCYKLAGVSSGFDYNSIKNNLDTYDFSNIEHFIKSLSDLNVMTGIDKYSFTNKLFKVGGINFLPALEDCSRFISIMTCISMKGSGLIPTYLSKFGEDNFLRVIEISKTIFK
jgi:hypothetical protein